MRNKLLSDRLYWVGRNEEIRHSRVNRESKLDREKKRTVTLNNGQFNPSNSYIHRKYFFLFFFNSKFDFLLGNFARNLLSQNIKKLINLRGNNLIRYAVDGRSPSELIMESLTLHLIRSPQKVVREGKKINSLTCWLESRQSSNLQWNSWTTRLSIFCLICAISQW